jgi:hypothetical protein
VQGRDLLEVAAPQRNLLEPRRCSRVAGGRSRSVDLAAR